MGAFKCSASVCVLALAAPASAETRQAVQLTTLFGSGNVVGDAPVPAPLWESLGGLRSGHDDRVRLVLTRHDAGQLRGVGTSAVLRVDLGLEGLGQGGAISGRDGSSWLGIAWQASARMRLGLRAYPFDTDYVRVGYLHALDWGGTNAARHESVFLTQEGGAPGAQLFVEASRWQLASTVKWATVPDPLSGPRRRWGGALNASFRLAPWLRLDAGFGLFQRPIGFLEGASVRVVLHGAANEPEVTSEPFRPPSLREDPGALEAATESGAALALEAVGLILRQESTERGRKVLTPAPALALYGSVRRPHWVAHAVVYARSLAFVQHTDERATPTLALASDLRRQAEHGAWLGGSISAPFGLVPSAELGARLPAAFLGPSALPGYAQTWAAGGSAGFEPLPVGAGRSLVWAARLAVRFRASASVALAGVADYQRDANRSRFSTSPDGVMRSFAAPDSLELLAVAQARF